MTSFIHVAPDGRICGFGSVPQGGIIFPLDGCETIEGVIAAPEAAYWDFEAQSLAPISPQPTAFHAWDWPTKQWFPNLDHAIATRKREIDAERERRNTLPIAYGGSLFDADATALRNIAGWQTQLAAGAVLPEGFVWRDADNVDHPADAAFLNGLGAAITLRGTALYQAAWTHKANIAALTDIDAIIGYDVTANWPV